MTSARAGLDSCVCGRGRAICADSKLIPCWLVGDRSVVTAEKFISYIVSRLAHRVQLTTGSHRAHLTAVDNAFGSEIGYAMLHKLHGAEPSGGETRYSPAQYSRARKAKIMGNPDPVHVPTSYAKRMNLQIRMGMQVFTLLTNAGFKRIENNGQALEL